MTGLETNPEVLTDVIRKNLGKNGKLENAALGKLIDIFRDVTIKLRVEKFIELSKINNIIDACLNIIEVAKAIRNDYSHERDSLLFDSPQVTEDTYNLIDLPRGYIGYVCRYLVP